MAIAPIDLQTIFSQVDKVGRSQAAQSEGQALAKTIQGVEIQQKTEERINQVNEAQNTGEGAEKINDQSHKQNQGGKNERRKHDEKEEAEEEKKLFIGREPSLGNKIDISL